MGGFLHSSMPLDNNRGLWWEAGEVRREGGDAIGDQRVGLEREEWSRRRGSEMDQRCGRWGREQWV